MDATLFTLINGSHHPWLDSLFITMSAIGTAGFVWIVIAILMMLYPRSRAGAWRLLLCVGLAYLVVDGFVKPVFDRQRPYEVIETARVIETKPTTSSFPSGHTAAAVAGAVAASRTWPVAAPLFWTMAALIALARVYLGVHYPVDIVAGALVGTACALFALGGRHRATYAKTLGPVPSGVDVRP